MKKIAAMVVLCLALFVGAVVSACKPQPKAPAVYSSSVPASPAGEDTWEASAQTTASSVSRADREPNTSKKPLEDSITVSVIAPRPNEVSSGSGAAGTGSTGSNTNANVSATGSKASSAVSTANPSSHSEWIEGDF